MKTLYILEKFFLMERIQKVANTILLLSEATDVETELVVNNQNLAHKLAHDYYNTGKNLQITPEEMDSEAMLALYKAAKSFDPDKDTKFSTYAFSVIKNELNRLVRDTKVRLGTVATTPGEYGTEIDEPREPGSEDFMGHSAPLPNEEAIRNEEREELMKRISELPQTQREALLRFWEGKGFAEIGEELGLTRAAVRQSIQQAAKKLRVRLKHFSPALA